MTYFDGLNTNEYERTIGNGSNSPLPVGFYEFVVTRNIVKKATMKAKDPNGQYIEVEFDVVQPQEHNRRKIWNKFNIINKSQDAVRIGREQLADLLQQIGITNLPAGELDETNPVPDMNGRMVCAYIAIEPGTNGYQDSNKCLKYLPSGSTVADYEAWIDAALHASKKGAAKASVAERKAWGATAAVAQQEVAAQPVAGAKPWGRKA